MATSNEEKIYENLKSIEEWALSGISQKEMAKLLDMGYSTFRDLKKKIPALSALLKKCADMVKAEKAKQVENVERSLYDRCLGYNAKVKKHIKVKKPAIGPHGQVLCDETGKAVMEEVLEEVIDEQHVPADVGAVKFFLLNKNKADWKNDPERLAIEKKRLANDTKRTELATNSAGGEGNGKTIEQILEEAEKAAAFDAGTQEEGGLDV